MTPDLRTRLRAALAAAGAGTPPFSGIASAVLVPLFQSGDGLHLLYTKRTDTLPQHGGQVSFPGGRHSPDADASLLATALRETEEEIGVRPDDVDVLGPLEPIHTFRSNFVISPFVGVIPHPYDFRPNTYEVAEIFSVPLATLRDPSTAGSEQWTIEGRTVPVPTFRHAGHTIWGATHRITVTLLDLLETIAVH